MLKYLLPLSLLSVTPLCAAGAGGREQNWTSMLSIIAITLVFFYFILWRPEKKRRQAMEAQRSSMRKGDGVTASGILGVIAQVKDKSIVIRTADGTKIEVLKAYVTDTSPGTGETASTD